MSLLVGIDVGTSSVKAIVTDHTGARLALGRQRTPWRIGPGRADITSDALYAACLQALRTALQAVPAQVVSAIGVTGIAESGFVTDRHADAVTAAVAWHDPHGVEEVARLDAEIGAPQLRRRTGQNLTLRLSAVKHRWLKNADPRAAAGHGWRTVPEEVVFRLGGRPVPELSQWSRTGFVDIRTGGYDTALSHWAGLDVGHLDPPVVAGTPMGRVDTAHPIPAIRAAVLTTAGHDHICAAHGVGIRSGDIVDSWGNGEALVRTTELLPEQVPVTAPAATLSWGVVEGQRVLFIGLGTGLVLHEVLTRLGGGPEVDHLELDERARAQSWTAHDERNPPSFDDSSAEPATAWRSALEWAFARVNAGVAAMERIDGLAERVIGCGGWLDSRPIRELKTERVSRFSAHLSPEPAATGAALLAARAVRQAPG